MLKPDQGLSVTSSNSHISPSGSPKNWFGALLQVVREHVDCTQQLVRRNCVRFRHVLRRSSNGPATRHDLVESPVCFGDHVPLDRSWPDSVTRLDLVGVGDLLAGELSSCCEKADHLRANQCRLLASEPSDAAAARGSSSGDPASIAAIKARASATSLSASAW